MKQNKPLISILLPVYNGEPYLQGGLDSILKQTYSHWELIAIDDGSTDASLSTLKHYAKQDKRIKVYSLNKNVGIAKALNHAIKHAQGQFIARMDADDVMYPNRLTLQIKYLLSHPDTVIIGGQCTLINTQGKTIGNKHFPLTHDGIYQLALLRSPMQHPAVMINRGLLPKNFNWYYSSQVPAEDLDLYFRLFHYGYAANLKNKLIKYRINPVGLTFINPRRTFKKAYSIRRHASSLYGYQASIFTQTSFIIQSVLIYILPETVTNLIYRLIIDPRLLFQSLKAIGLVALSSRLSITQ